MILITPDNIAPKHGGFKDGLRIEKENPKKGLTPIGVRVQAGMQRAEKWWISYAWILSFAGFCLESIVACGDCACKIWVFLWGRVSYCAGAAVRSEMPPGYRWTFFVAAMAHSCFLFLNFTSSFWILASGLYRFQAIIRCIYFHFLITCKFLM